MVKETEEAPTCYFDLVPTWQDVNTFLLEHNIRDFEGEILIWFFFFGKSFDIEMSGFLFM